MTKLAVLSGASMGIGKQIALELVKNGYDLCLLTHNQTQAEQLKREVSALNHQCVYYSCRVENEQEIANAFQLIKKKYGQIDLVFTNMGIMPDNPDYPTKKIGELQTSDWQTVFKNNFLGVLNSATYAVKTFEDNPNGGKIINCAFYGLKPQGQHAIYLVSRKAIQAVNETINLEYPNIEAKMLVSNGSPLANQKDILKQLDQFLKKGAK